MKLEEALPEIRKGRRFKRVADLVFSEVKQLPVIYTIDLLADDWELEPLPAPKMKAWISEEGDVRFFKDGDMEYQNWIRAEWLDQP